MQSPTLSPELLRGVSSLDPEERQRADPAAAAQPGGPRARHPRRADRPAQADEQTSPRGCATTCRRTSKCRRRSASTAGRIRRAASTCSTSATPIATPGRAQRIANRVADVFVEENSKQSDQPRRRTPPTSSSSRSRQVAAPGSTTSKSRLRAKKQNFIGRLPEQIGANVQMVNGARSQFESIVDADSRPSRIVCR